MIDYAASLNPAQLDAATCSDNSALVIAGAGSGKTRVIVYRLAWLTEHNVSPESILLLTFTRKAAHEMLARAANLLGRGLDGISGGTFHAFAYGALRRYPPEWLSGRAFTLMDAPDAAQALRQCKDALKLGKKDTSFPKIQTIASIISKARNKELPIEEILRRDSFHLLPHADALDDLANSYTVFRREKGLLDYDDLLTELENLLTNNPVAANRLRAQFSNILVDEYQDTNLIQARITRLLAGPPPEPGHEPVLTARVMAVGDEAQSIYAFRGANVRNILDFPRLFPNSRVIRLEENYRSTQPVLNIANSILEHAPESFHKRLFTAKSGGKKPKVITPLSDASQAQIVARRIEELLNDYLPHEIAVLFRAGFHSYPLENALRQAKIPFRKYGGLRLVEASHVKDVISFARLALNPLDLPAFSRIASMHKGIGPKTIERLHGQLARNDVDALKKSLFKFPGFLEDLAFIDEMRQKNIAPATFFQTLLEYYRPRLETLYPDDWPQRSQGLEEILQIVQGYNDLDLFVADLALEAPEEETSDDAERFVTLSTVHSAKGLEWKAVLLIDVVEDRFPSRHAQARDEDFEEERRLFYVACTRAKEILEIYAPAAVYSRSDNCSMPVARSPFLRELDSGCYEAWNEKFGGLLESEKGKTEKKRAPFKKMLDREESALKTPATCEKPFSGKTGYCRHRIFGRGKIIRQIDDEKVQVNFPGFGLKVILVNYLSIEE